MQCLTDTGSGTYAVTSPQPTLLTDCTLLLAQPSDLPFTVYDLPSTADMQTAFMLTFVPIVLFYLAAYFLNTIVSFFDSNRGG